MSKVFKVVGVVAGVVAVVASGGAALGVFAAAAAGGALGSAAGIAAIAGAVSAVAGVAANLTAKPPPARGTVNQTTIGANQPLPYLMGETYSGGAILHEAGYGATRKKVKNPYYFRAMTFSFCGPVSAFVGLYGDFSPITLSGAEATGFYSGFLYADAQLGDRPEANALAPWWAGCPDWGSDYKLSGHAAIGISALFDKEGERFASGLPQLGAVWRGVKVYDPRLDSTRPGGSGTHRINDEATWGYSENPACHAVSYAYGRYMNGVKVFGVDLGDAAIDIAGAMAWANLCDANGWKVGGTIYEPGDKWNNLKLICQAGGCEPVLSGGFLRWRWQKPHVSLKTITPDHLANPDMEVPSNQTWKARRNTIVPKWRSSANQWEYVQSAAVTRSIWLEEDGEAKEFEQEFTLVQQANQAAQLGAYQLAEERGAGTITLVLKPEFMTYDPGDGLTLNIAEADLNNTPVIVTSRSVAPDTGEVTLTFMTRDGGVDAWALAQTGTGPGATTVTSPQERDEAGGNNQNPLGYESTLIATSSPSGFAEEPITAVDAGDDCTITVPDHDRVYADRTVAVTGADITGIEYDTLVLIYYDDEARAGGAVTYAVTTNSAEARISSTYPNRHYVGAVTTPSLGGGPVDGDGGAPPGGGPIP